MMSDRKLKLKLRRKRLPTTMKTKRFLAEQLIKFGYLMLRFCLLVLIVS